MKDIEILRAIGKQVASGNILFCPLCYDKGLEKEEQQDLSSEGDKEELLFCPHCDLTIRLTMEWNPDK